MSAASRIWSPLLQAGAFGALHGGHPGDPSPGLCVPVRSEAELRAALDALNLGHTRATLLAAPALAGRAPDLLRGATEQGHEVAGYGNPLGANLAALDVAAGQAVRHWGLTPEHLNAQALRQLQRQQVRPLPLWSEGHPDSAIRPGGVVLASAAELGRLLPHLKARGYQPKPVRDLPDLRAGTPRDLFEAAYQHVIEDRYAEREGIIDISERFDAVLRGAALPYAPDPLPLPRSAPTAELHLNSGRVVGLASRQWLGTYRAYQRSLKDVARALHTHPQLQDAQAVFAVTLFHSPLEKSGFELLDLPPLRAKWYGLGFRLLRLAYGTTRAQKESTPKMAWMRREEFLERFGGAS